RHGRTGKRGGGVRAQVAAGAGRGVRPPALQGADRVAPRGAGRVLKAHSRLFEHLTLATDVLLIALCWVAAYGLRFYVVGPPLVTPDVPPFREYLLQLAPIVLVWGVAFRWFDLYRPRRLGSYVSEWGDLAKASTTGVLVLIAIMQFVFRKVEYSRVVIVYFWVLSIVAVS